MRYFAWIIGLLLSVLLFGFVALFTPFGNNLLKPLVESQIQARTELPVKLQTFRLSINKLDATLLLSEDNSLHVSGNYSLFKQSVALTYLLQIAHLESLASFTKKQLYGSVDTNGTIQGDKKFLSIDGNSNLIKSDTSYHVELSDFDPTSIIAKIQGAKLQNLLALLGEKIYASADMEFNVNLKNIKPHQLDGAFGLHVSNSRIDYAMMKRTFGVDLPKTDFKLDADAKLQGDSIIYSADFDSQLAKITSKGQIDPSPLNVNLEYNLHVKELAMLRPIIKAPLRGELNLDGSAKGTQKSLHVSGKSDLALSQTAFDLVLENLVPKTLHATLHQVNLAKLLYMVSQPHFADALVNMDIKVDDFASLDGVINTNVTNGVLDEKYISSAYGVKNMPRVAFDASSVTHLALANIDTALQLNSSLATLKVKQARFDLLNGSLSSDYLLHVSDLNRLYFLTKRSLKGSLDVSGKIKKDDDLDIVANSEKFGGKINLHLHNDDLQLDASHLQTSEISQMLSYQKVFISEINTKATYKLLSKSGKFNTQITEGHFGQNQVIDLVKQYAKTDLYTERFAGDLDGVIAKDIINATLHLHSNNATIDTKKLLLNTQTNSVNSIVRVEANKNPLTFTINGDMQKPRVGIDATELIKKEAGKAVQKELGKFLKGLF